MFVSDLFESNAKQVLVIYPGRFQPVHRGHAQVFDHLRQKYGSDNVFICTSNKVEQPKSPFSFDEKKKMIELTGIPGDRVVFDPQPYRGMEIVQHYDAANTVLLFAVSEKDMAEDPRFQFKPKKDGSPSYFQPLKNINKCETLDKHAYITTVPTFNFTVLGRPANSASQIRAQFASADLATQKKIVTDLFGKFDPEVFNIMKSKLGAVVESQINEYDISDRIYVGAHVKTREDGFGTVVRVLDDNVCKVKLVNGEIQSYKMRDLFPKVETNPMDESAIVNESDSTKKYFINDIHNWHSAINRIGYDKFESGKAFNNRELIAKWNSELNEGWVSEEKMCETAEVVDLWGMQEEEIRKMVLETPCLFENTNDYKDLQRFFQLHKTKTPVPGEKYCFVSVHCILPGRIITFSYFDQTEKFIKIDQNNMAYFDVNGIFRQYPYGESINGDLLKFTFMFDSLEAAEQLRTLVSLKFSDWRITIKPITLSKLAECDDYITTLGLAKNTIVETKQMPGERDEDFLDRRAKEQKPVPAQQLRSPEPVRSKKEVMKGMRDLQSQKGVSESIESDLLNADPKIRALANAVVKMKQELYNITGGEYQDSRLSESINDAGKNLGGPYPSKKQAAKRLGQVEYFKHKGKTNEGVSEKRDYEDNDNYDCHCYEIGGPWIDVDPNCPIHNKKDVSWQTNETIVPGFGEMRPDQIQKEINAMLADMQKYARNGNMKAVAEYIKKLQPFVDSVSNNLSESIIRNAENALRVAKRNAI